jgi:hypothetical protein
MVNIAHENMIGTSLAVVQVTFYSPGIVISPRFFLSQTIDF